MPRIWLPFKHASLPVVSVRFRASAYLALVDSAAETSLISPGLVIKHGLPQTGMKAIKTIEGRLESRPQVELFSLGFAKIQLAKFQAVRSRVSSLGLGIQLILGVNAFTRRRVQLDYIENRVYLLE
jgi:Aspartyl protease